MIRLTVVLVAGLMAAACAKPVEYQYVSTEFLRNSEGHVVGHKELMVDASDGQEIEQVTHYSPRYNENGEVTGYEEAVPGGALIRSVNGRRVGMRYTDLRSRGSNRGNEGISITVQP